MREDEIYRKAAKKVRAKKGFFYHLIAYLGVIGMLYAIMYFENDDILPVIIVAISWGIGLASHYFAVFGTEHLDFLGFEPDWEKQEIQKEMDRIRAEERLQERAEMEDHMEEEMDEYEGLELKEMEKRKLDRDEYF